MLLRFLQLYQKNNAILGILWSKFLLNLLQNFLMRPHCLRPGVYTWLPLFMSLFYLSHSFVYLLYFCPNWNRSQINK